MCMPGVKGPNPGSLQNPIRCKLVIVGDGNVGKTGLVRCFVTKKLAVDGEYTATIFDSHVMDVKWQNKHVEYLLWDTAGQEEYDRLRLLAYPDSDVIMVCFSVGDPETLDNVLELWLPEINRHCRGIPFILAGCKSDLRADKATIDTLAAQEKSPITYREGFQVAQDIGAVGYVETSAKLGLNVEAAFLQALSATEKLRKRKRPCIIL
ncbi:hypothetical protein BC940DRAFT_304008 [Gongronella butleri]|nr:hypothetical protein BC940DRAFT_304008 [Gongronella butleri]